MSRTTWNQQAVAFVAVLCIASPAISADHRDGPRVTTADRATVALDLNDLYAFVSPANQNNSVLILTTGGNNVGLDSDPFFLPGAVHEIRVSNDGVPTNDEIVFLMVFSNPDSFGRQNYTVRLLRNKKTTGGRPNPPVIARGVTGQRIAGSLGIKVQAGIFDDPFFFDSGAFNRFRANTIQGVPLPARAAPFLTGTAINGFRRNTLAIVLELPRVQLLSNPNNPNITLWLRTVRPDGMQFDRTALPAINTAVLFELPLFEGRPNLQNFFNDRIPANDAELRGEAALRINHIYGLPLTGSTPTGLNAMQLAGVVLPDVMPFNTTSTSGFLNGRRLTDDVIDAELNLLTGGVLTTDRVSNDSVFLNQFPYLGAPIPNP